jgi:hypothetical protein
VNHIYTLTSTVSMRPEILICNPVTFLQTENLSTIHAFDGESYERWYINQEPKKRYLPLLPPFLLKGSFGSQGRQPREGFPCGADTCTTGRGIFRGSQGISSPSAIWARRGLAAPLHTLVNHQIKSGRQEHPF